MLVGCWQIWAAVEQWAPFKHILTCCSGFSCCLWNGSLSSAKRYFENSLQQNFFQISFTFLFVCSQSVDQELKSQVRWVRLCLRLDQTVDICLWRGRRWCSEATGNCQWKKSTFFPKLTLQFECLRVSEQEGGWFSQSLERASIKSFSKVWQIDWRETVSTVLWGRGNSCRAKVFS